MNAQEAARALHAAEDALRAARNNKIAIAIEIRRLVKELGAELTGFAAGERLGMAVAKGAAGDILWALADVASMFIGVGELKAGAKLLRASERIKQLYERFSAAVHREKDLEKIVAQMRHTAEHVPAGRSVAPHHPAAPFNKIDPHGVAVSKAQQPYRKPLTGHQTGVKPHSVPPSGLAGLGQKLKGAPGSKPKMPVAPTHEWKYFPGQPNVIRNAQGVAMSTHPYGTWQVVEKAH